MLYTFPEFGLVTKQKKAGTLIRQTDMSFM